MSWFKHYKDRINSSYQNYFEKRYKPFLNMIIKQNNKNVIEMGCGIGSVSKYLLKQGYNCSGYDISPSMVTLANLNTGVIIFKEDDIFTHKMNNRSLGVSHGVLEHFKDEQIVHVCNSNPGSIHYVPLDKYKTPSFGDERLLPLEYWLNLVKPHSFEVFNDCHDLVFKV